VPSLNVIILDAEKYFGNYI